MTERAVCFDFGSTKLTLRGLEKFLWFLKENHGKSFTVRGEEELMVTDLTHELAAVVIGHCDISKTT